MGEYARDLDHPRWLYVLPNGDVLVAESNAPDKPGGSGGIVGWVKSQVKDIAGAGVESADRITLLRDEDGDGKPDVRTVFLDNLHSPFGMALVGDDLYVANTDAVVRFPYSRGDTRIEGESRKIVDLPAGKLNQHWTRNLVASPDGSRLYVAIGSTSNVGENGMGAEEGRAAVWEVDPATGKHSVYASGLRNPVGMDWEPHSGRLWVAVNERDELGGDLVPDYMTALERGAFYGWPYSYFGDHVDARVTPQHPAKVAEAVKPDYALGAHTASLGLAFADGANLTARFSEGAFVGQHGSWNRRPPSGYKVIFVPFRNGRPDGMPRDVLTGFLNAQGEARGRPVGIAVDDAGALLVADDAGNRIWRVSAAEAAKPQIGESE